MRARILAAGCIFWMVLGLHPPLAVATEPDRELERSLFEVAERALAQGNLASFDVTRPLLVDYPLLPYLDYRRLARNLSAADPRQIADFISGNPDLPLAAMLLNHYLDHLAKEEQWDTFLDFSPGPEVLSTELACRHRQALLETDRTADALRGVESIWLHERSQPKACDRVFDAWRAAGGLNERLAWERFQLAVDAGETGLARYLRRYLGAEDRVWAERALELESHPDRVVRTGFAASGHPGAAWMLERAWTRFARRDHEAMRAAWSTDAQARAGLDAEAIFRIDRSLALTLARRENPEALAFLNAMDADAFDSDLRDWQLRAALREGEWEIVSSVSGTALAEDPEDSRWNYWHARAALVRGDDERATAFFRRASLGRDLHAFLAADRIDQPYRINHDPVKVSAEQLAELEDQPAMQRMRELVHFERLPETRREWNAFSEGLSEGQLIAAARLFDEWGWYDGAIFTLARARSWDDIDIRFPLAFVDLITEAATTQGIDPAWAMAVARQESAFIPDVRSGAGALGLMQIMPSTGRSIAASAGVRIRSDSDILKPDANARLGTYYLKRNLERFDGHVLLSTAAYNAGSSRVRSWLPEGGRMEPDVWIELIPFNETRKYVERVLAYQVLYSVRMGDRPKALATLLFPVTPQAALGEARDQHLAMHAPAGLHLALREICDAPGYSIRYCRLVEE